jgi:hypothetical protein
MEEFVEFKRRIRPELLEKIEVLMFKEEFGIDVTELPETTDEDAKEFVRKNPDPDLDEYYKKNGLEKMMFAIGESMNVMEDSIIGSGECFWKLQTNLPLEEYLDSLKRINCSMERAALCIQAWKEDKQNG